MQNKIALEEHFATEATLGDSQVFGAHVWAQLGPRLLDIQDMRLREMDKHGVEMMILSLNAPAVQAIHDVKRAIAVAREANDTLAAEVGKRPSRFAAFAALPMQNPDAAIRERLEADQKAGILLDCIQNCGASPQEAEVLLQHLSSQSLRTLRRDFGDDTPLEAALEREIENRPGRLVRQLEQQSSATSRERSNTIVS